MSLLTRIRTNPHLKALARRLEKQLKRWLVAGLQRCLKAPEPETIDSLDGVRKILLIRPNFRLGNALISTPVIDAFHTRFPSARIDFLATDSTLPLLQQHPVERFHLLSRKTILRPWQCVSLLRRLRAEHYDLAVQISAGSLTGTLFTRSIGARYSMGMRRGEQRWFHIEVDGKAKHAYDSIVNLTRPLGVPCRNRPLLRLTPLERHQAFIHLRQLSVPLIAEDSVAPFIAVFVGGHQNKRWPLSFWLEVMNSLERQRLRHVVFLGPEEFRLARTLQLRLGSSTYGTLCNPRPLREFAAMLERADLIVTPDSGPMHLAAALDVPVIALVRDKKSLAFVPKGSYDTMLWQPNSNEVMHAVQATLIALEDTGPALQSLSR